VEHPKQEIIYAAYGENIEAMVKLLSCSKAINLIDYDNDLRPKRMFITSYGSKHDERQMFGSSCLKVTGKLQETPIFNKLVRKQNFLDKKEQTLITKKQRCQIRKLKDL